jgi:hypothetical protein
MMTDTAPPPNKSPKRAPVLPPFPEISLPKSDDKRRAAISFGAQMAEAEALWQLQARA